MKHRVYVKFLGKTALVEVCKDGLVAAGVTLRLRNRYRSHRVEFLHTMHDLTTDTPWLTIKECLNETVSDTYLRGRN